MTTPPRAHADKEAIRAVTTPNLIPFFTNMDADDKAVARFTLRPDVGET